MFVRNLTTKLRISACGKNIRKQYNSLVSCGQRVDRTSLLANAGWKTTHVRQILTPNKQRYLSKCLNNTMEVNYLEVPDKSENDKKLYKSLVLANGIRVLLVSDPSPVPNDGITSSSCGSSGESVGEDDSSDEMESISSTAGSDESYTSEEGDEMLAACALLVNFGSFSEPSKYPGLAHFLEHMIFMGSEKYPEENAFDVHIKKCGGFDNAHTDSEETVFYFEVSEEHLESSIDYFSALFKEPLMKKEAMTRERDAVDSEFDQTQLDDEARRDQLLASLASEGFPHGGFAWGNSKSLKHEIDDDDLHKTLHEFRSIHYSSHRMCVCVQARLPIDEIEGMVVKHFSEIPCNNIQRANFNHLDYRKAFSDDFHKNVFFVKPIENVCKLELTWVLPSMLEKYKCKPEHFIAYILGYEGEGSLCAYLRKKLWGLDLIAGPDDSGFDSNSIYTLFNMCIYLSDDGFKHLDEVLAVTFAYVQLLKDKLDDMEEVYNNLQFIESTSFRFQHQKAAFDNVQNLVTQTNRYPSKDILTGVHIYYEYNKEEVKAVIDQLNDLKFNIMISSKLKYDGIVYDQEEKWFGTQYTTIPMPEKWVNLWNESKPIAELFLPKSNPFISNDFSIFWLESGKPELPSVPKKILQSDICELWFKQDDKFSLPYAFMNFYFISPLPRKSVKNDVMCALYEELIKFCLAEELYPASVADLSYHFYAADKGVVLKVNGYNEKLDMVVNIIVNAMTKIDCEINDQIFDVLKMKLTKHYYNVLIKPAKLNKDVRLSIIHKDHWPLIEKYKAIKDITLMDIKNFSKIFTEELYVRTLMQGNLTEEIAHNVMNSVLTTLNCQHIQEPNYIEDRVMQLPKGSNFVRVQTLNDQDNNTVVCNYYQIGPNSVRLESILDLLMMFVEEPLYANLRTKEQLGYSVSSSVRINFGISGYSIILNSQENKFTASYVEERIEAFRIQMIEILQNMASKEYEHVRASLIKIKQVVDMSLNDEVERNWGEIECGEYMFDRRRKEIEILRTLTKEEIIDFCLNNERTNLRKLSIQIIGHSNVLTIENEENEKNSNLEGAQADDMDIEDINDLPTALNFSFIPTDNDKPVIEDIYDFKKNLHVFPVTKTIVDDSTTESEIIEQAYDTTNVN